MTDIVTERAESLLRVANDLGVAIPVEDFLLMLPEEGPQNPTELSQWMETHPSFGHILTGFVVPSEISAELDVSLARLSEERVAEARRLLAGPLRDLKSLARCVAVTGSTAFGTASARDDIDFLVVTKKGALWFFLASAFLLMRLKWKGRVTMCFNYVLDDSSVETEFLSSRHIIFAREALTLKVLEGEDYYSWLLCRTPWLTKTFPRMRKRFGNAATCRACVGTGKDLGIAVLNATLFPLLGAYLILVGMVRNRRHLRAGQEDRMFRTEVEWHRMALKSQRFERLKDLYGE